MKIKVLIVEDEMLVAEDLSDFLTEEGFDSCGIAIDSESCFEAVNKDQPDIVIMDICIKGKLDGIEIAKILNQTKQIPIIFLTANTDETTVARALPLNPCAYLSKPFNKKDVKIAIELACKKYNGDVIFSNTNSNNTIESSIFLRDGSHYKRIEIASILYIEAKGSYSVIVTTTKTYTLSYNLNHFTEQVKNPVFKKVHRSFIVNINKVDGFDSNSLVINRISIPVSKQHHKEVMNMFLRL